LYGRLAIAHFQSAPIRAVSGLDFFRPTLAFKHPSRVDSRFLLFFYFPSFLFLLSFV